MKTNISTVLSGIDIERLNDVLEHYQTKENPITPSALIRFLIREEARLLSIRKKGNRFIWKRVPRPEQPLS